MPWVVSLPISTSFIGGSKSFFWASGQSQIRRGMFDTRFRKSSPDTWIPTSTEGDLNHPNITLQILPVSLYLTLPPIICHHIVLWGDTKVGERTILCGSWSWYDVGVGLKVNPQASGCWLIIPSWYVFGIFIHLICFSVFLAWLVGLEDDNMTRSGVVEFQCIDWHCQTGLYM